MPVRGLRHEEEVVADLHAEAMAWVGDDVRWLDVHTHIGHADPDGYEADPADLIEALDAAGQHAALVFPMHEPDGYGAANDIALEAAAASGGRLMALARVDPNRPGAVDEARRCLDAGARGIKLHPRSDAFGLPHPVVDEIVALAGERRLAVLFHAGRGIPNLGDAAIALAHDNPGARLILAHAGISDLGLVAPRAAGIPNLLFDTSWWQIADVLTLFATVPPGQILYASDMPYGPPRLTATGMVRCARAVGLSREQVAAIAGAQSERVLAGEDLLDLGPAPGTGALGPRVLGFERAVSYLTAAVHMAFRGGDPTEALAMARLACQASAEAPYAERLREIDALVARAQSALGGDDHYAVTIPAMVAQFLAGTSSDGR